MSVTPALSHREIEPIRVTWVVDGMRSHLRNTIRAGLDDHLIAQNEAKQAIYEVMVKGLYHPFKDKWVFWALFFAGPTWVGKSASAEALAEMLLGDSDGYTSIACSTLAHPGDIGRLTGSGAWYTWYGDTPVLSDTRLFWPYRQAKKSGTLHPLLDQYGMGDFSIVQVDEIEKACPEIAWAFLTMLQNWRVELGSGKEGSNTENSKGISHSRFTDIRNTLFIFSSNIGEHVIKASKNSAIGFGTGTTDTTSSDTTIFKRELEKRFAPEFLGRMDKVVRLHHLSEEERRRMIELKIAKFNKKLSKAYFGWNLQIAVSASYAAKIMQEEAWKWREYGARPIEALIKDLESNVWIIMNSGKLPEDMKWGMIHFDIAKEGTTEVYFSQGNSWWAKRWSQQVTKIINKDDIARSMQGSIEKKVRNYEGNIRAVVGEYMNLMKTYEVGYRSIANILRRRLNGYGFKKSDIAELEKWAFMDLHINMLQPLEIEEIITTGADFWGRGFSFFKKFINTSILRNKPIEEIYRTVRVIVNRPLTESENIIISQYIHRTEVWRTRNRIR